MTEGLITVNSLSGGKTSSYIAANYPADLNIFSLVVTDDHNCGKLDKGLKKKIGEKFCKYAPHWHDFRGGALPRTRG